jgi:mercuric ion binding protein
MRKLLFVALVTMPLAALAVNPKTVTLDVQNMTCSLCPITVKKSLEKVSGVTAVQVNFDKKTATCGKGPRIQTMTMKSFHSRFFYNIHEYNPDNVLLDEV